MTNSQLYETMFKRKSIRKYDMTPLDDAAITKIKNYASGIKPLDERIPYEFTYLSSDDVKNLFPIKAPHYICLYSGKKDGHFMNAGFLLQQMDLYFSANNIGSCWLGMAKPSKELPERKDGMEFIMMIAFGKTAEPLHRSRVSEFKRKGLGEITNIAGMEDVLEPVRLAPSASNSQPWFISGSGDELIVSRKSLNVITSPIFGKFNQIDTGIALFHLWLSLDHQGKIAAFEFKKTEVPKGYDYMATVRIRSNNEDKSK